MLLVGSSVVVRSSVVGSSVGVGSSAAMDGILRGAPGMVPVTRGPTSSMSEAPPALGPPTLSRGGGSQYWVDHADMASVDSLFLEDSTKAQIEALFGLLDSNKDGVITLEDFVAVHPQSLERQAEAKWEVLRSEFDFDGNSVVEAHEFINGLKRMALKLPLDAQCFAQVPSSHRECLLRLNQSTNNVIQNLCRDLHAARRVEPA